MNDTRQYSYSNKSLRHSSFSSAKIEKKVTVRNIWPQMRVVLWPNHLRRDKTATNQYDFVAVCV